MKVKKEVTPQTVRILVAVVMPLAALLFLAVLINGFWEYRRSFFSYDDLTYCEYVFESCERKRDPEMGSTNLIYVREQEKPLKINNVLSTKAIENKLDALRAGDRICCYLYEEAGVCCVAELVGDDGTILSLSEFQRVSRGNGMGTVIIMSIFVVFCLSASVVSAIVYRRERKKIFWGENDEGIIHRK